MQATANEKQSASDGLMIAKLQGIGMDENNQLTAKISRRDAVFAFLPPQQKGKIQSKTLRALRLERVAI
jgi:hypothetical protein